MANAHWRSAIVAPVVLVVMRIRSRPGVVRVLAVASVFWLTILLGRGAMDPLTRTNYPAQFRANTNP
jgi:hypothetical protein